MLCDRDIVTVTEKKNSNQYIPLVCKGIYRLLFFLCPVADIRATVAMISVKLCMMIHIGSGHLLVGKCPTYVKRERKLSGMGNVRGYMSDGDMSYTRALSPMLYILERFRRADMYRSDLLF